MEALLQRFSVPQRGHAVIFVFHMKFPEDLCPGMFCSSQILVFFPLPEHTQAISLSIKVGGNLLPSRVW